MGARSQYSVEYRWAVGDEHRLRTYAAELVGMAPDVLFAAATPALVALNRETRSLPIVFGVKRFSHQINTDEVFGTHNWVHLRELVLGNASV